jgi:hypothetical protein
MKLNIIFKLLLLISTFLLLTSSVTATNLTEDLVFSWELNGEGSYEGGADNLINVGGSYDSFIFKLGGSSWSSGSSSSMNYLEKNNTYTFDFGNAYTLSAWVYWDGNNFYYNHSAGSGNSSSGGIFGVFETYGPSADITCYSWGRKYYQIRVYDDGRIGAVSHHEDCNVAGMYITSTTGIIQEDTWYHIMAVHDGSGNFNLYVNNTSVISNSSHPTSFSMTKKAYVGVGKRYYYSGTYPNNEISTYWSGNIDSVQFYERALNSSDRDALYNSFTGVQPFGSTPVTAIPHLSNVNCSSSGDTIAPYTTADTTPTFKFETNISAYCRMSAINQSFLSMNSSDDCQTTGGLNHTCSLSPSHELTLPSTSVYVACANIWNTSSESVVEFEMNITGLDTNATNQILYGIEDSSIYASMDVYENQQVFLRNLNNDQFVGTVDAVGTYADQRWIINYDESGQVGLFNLSPSVYSLDLFNITVTSIASVVTDFIDGTVR